MAIGAFRTQRLVHAVFPSIRSPHESVTVVARYISVGAVQRIARGRMVERFDGIRVRGVATGAPSVRELTPMGIVAFVAGSALTVCKAEVEGAIRIARRDVTLLTRSHDVRTREFERRAVIVPGKVIGGGEPVGLRMAVLTQWPTDGLLEHTLMEIQVARQAVGGLRCRVGIPSCSSPEREPQSFTLGAPSAVT
jgi:hypothetical protein